jgi:catechol 2,3-dioxygenase-like lactoylglutathione lyase family enzyme
MLGRRTLVLGGAIVFSDALAGCGAAKATPSSASPGLSITTRRYTMAERSRTQVGNGIPAQAGVVTLGARDFGKLRDFYCGLGWPQAVDQEDFAAFALRGAVLGIFPIEKLAADAKAVAARPDGGLRFSLAIVVDRREEVDAVIASIRGAGGRITKEPVDSTLFHGRSAYFADPEDNYWEVVWAPEANGVVAAARRAMADQ